MSSDESGWCYAIVEEAYDRLDTAGPAYFQSAEGAEELWLCGPPVQGPFPTEAAAQRRLESEIADWERERDEKAGSSGG